MAGGAGHTCAVTATGSVKCWGANYQAQLGDKQACGTPCQTPVDVVGVTIHRPGTIVGKALESLDSGAGEILVLLTLQ